MVKGINSMRRLLCRSIIVAVLTTCWVVSSSAQAALQPAVYRVNVPNFDTDLRFDESGVFWFGRVTPTENYADVRVASFANKLWVHVNIMDLQLWYDTTPSANTLTDWDSVTLYLDKRGNIGSTPTTDSYRFDGQLNWWEPRVDWQTAYRGDGSGWVSTPITFETYGTWYGVEPPNVVGGHHGWYIAFVIPFSSLGLSGLPPQGTIWGLGIALHDRDTATGPMNPDKLWPLSLAANQPSSWGQMRFGLPGYTLPGPAVKQGTTVVRQGLNGATVQDGVVGGNTLCGGNLSDYFAQWGNLNYAHQIVFNVQNAEQISEWPCFSKAFVTFPLTALPSGKTIISATLTLYHRGNPGPAPEPAYIQVLTVNDDWNESTLTWNNAPYARENLGGVWIPSLSTTPPYPGIPYTWNVSRAVAEAYSTGQPLRLALYSASSPFHNGRYFHSSDVEELNAQGRPTLTITWGEPMSVIHKTVWPPVSSQSRQVTYTLSFLGSGHALTLTDNLPAQVSQPGPIRVMGTGNAVYDVAAHRITWTGSVASGQVVSLTFPVTVLVSNPTAIYNSAVLMDAISGVTTDGAVLLANAFHIWLPLTRRP